jgi:hypothetical protein
MSTAMGAIVMSFFIIALLYYFVNFLLTFTTNQVVDSSGKPVHAQSRRFFYLK